MKKFFKILGIIILVIVLLLLTLPFLFKDKIIEVAKSEINKQLNAKVDFGDFDLSIISSFPSFKFEIENVSVKNGNDFDSMQLAYIKNLAIHINLQSIIDGKQYEVNKISIDGLELNALVLKDGKANWDIAKNKDTTIQAEEKPDTSEQKFNLSLEKLSITNTNISFEDRQGRNLYVVKNLNYTLKGAFTNDLTDIAMGLNIEALTAKMGAVSYLNKANLSVDLNLDADLKNKKFTIKKNSINLNALALQINGWVQLLPKGDIDMDIKLNVGDISFKNLLSLVPVIYTNSFKDLQASGNVSLNVLAKGKKTKTLLPKFDVNLLVHKAQFKYPSLPKSVDNIGLDLHIFNKDGHLDSTVVDVKQLHLDMASNPVDLSVLIKNPISDPAINANIKGRIDFNSIKEFIPLTDAQLSGLCEINLKLNGAKSMIDKKQYDKFNAEGSFVIKNIKYVAKSLNFPVNVEELELVFNPRKIELKKLLAQMGKTDIKANGSIENFLSYALNKEEKLLKGSFNLNSDYIDLNELSPADTTQIKEEKKATTTSNVIAVPNDIDFNINANIKKILFQKMPIQNLHGNILVKDGKANLNNLSMEMLQGSLTLSGLYNTENIKKPFVNFNIDANKIDIQDAIVNFNTVAAITPYAKECWGGVSLKITMSTLLTDSMTPVLKSLYSKGKLKTHSLKLKGPKTEELAEKVKLSQLKEISVGDIDIPYELKEGKLTMEPFDMELGGVKTKTFGWVSIEKEMDMKMQMKIPFSAIKQYTSFDVESLLKEAKQYDIAIELPEFVPANLNISGNVLKPNYAMSVDNSFQDNLKQSVKKGVENKLNKEKERLINEAKKKVDEEKERLMNEAKKKADQEKEKLLEKGKNELKKLLPF